MSLDSQIHQAIESHIKVLPNLATRAIQTVNNSNFYEQRRNSQNEISQEFKKTAGKTFILREISPIKIPAERNGKRCQKIGTDRSYIYENTLSTTLPSIDISTETSSPTKHRLRGIKRYPDEIKKISLLEQTNQSLRDELDYMKNYLENKLNVLNIRPKGELKRLMRLQLNPSNEADERPMTKTAISRPKTLSPLNLDVRFIDHNKETLYNIKSANNRPITDGNWVKAMQMSPRNQINRQDERSQPTAENSWRHEPDPNMSLSKIDFGSIKGDVLVKPTYTYCKVCYDSSDFIKLQQYSPRSVSVPKKLIKAQ
ncbi:unnamed protein product [Blepharisma stoltei]|uniref:Uncharacterized protein n=1 Tax=Blepharisma stoltei TaxID=1481888 RepID=A0AAU9IN34_9CILI|nr:unnamed protein product [Blepharisma stoltei]